MSNTSPMLSLAFAVNPLADLDVDLVQAQVLTTVGGDPTKVEPLHDRGLRSPVARCWSIELDQGQVQGMRAQGLARVIDRDVDDIPVQVELDRARDVVLIGIPVVVF